MDKIEPDGIKELISIAQYGDGFFVRITVPPELISDVYMQLECIKQNIIKNKLED